MTNALPINRKRDEPPREYLCAVAISSARDAATCICGAPVRWGYDGDRTKLEHGPADPPGAQSEDLTRKECRVFPLRRHLDQ